MAEPVLRYDAPAERWLECLPLGNGALGAMVDGALGVTRIALNDETAWSGSPASEARGGVIDADAAAAALAEARAAIGAGDPAAAERALQATQVRYSQAFLPFATLAVHLDAPESADYRRELDLADALHTVRSGAVVVTTLVSAVHGVLAVHVAGAPVTALDLETPLQELGRTPDELRVRLPSDVAPTHEPEAVGVSWSSEPGTALEGAVVVGRRDVPGGVLLVAATQTTFAGLGAEPSGTATDAAATARARVEAALADGWDALLAAHRADVRPRLARARVDLGEVPAGPDGAPLSTGRRLDRAAQHPDGPLAADPALVALLFAYGRYLLLSSSRPGGLPPTLQGIWNDRMQPPWSSNYTLNINAEMNVWAAHTTGLPESVEPLLDFVIALAEAGTPTARRLYGTRGWVAHHNSDAWLLTAPVGAGHGDARWTAWPMAGPWLATVVGDALSFGALDDERLRALWPALRGVAEFLLDWVRETPDGQWSTAPATSPENAYLTAGGEPVAVDTTTTMDLTLARAALEVVGDAAGRLGLDDAVVSEARALARRLPAEPPLTADGLVREWAAERTPDDPHHRHVSHLFGLYPGAAPWSADARVGAARSLDARGDESSGWSLVWKGMLWARLGRGDRVADFCRLLFRDAEELSGPWAGGLYPNLFAAHPPFQIDANLAFPALLAEALLQSHDGIHLLPALPPDLPDGEARGLVARPGVDVDLVWRGGALVSATLRSRAEATVRVRWAGATIERSLVPGTDTRLSAADFPARA